MIAFGGLARKLNIIDKESMKKMSRIVTNFFYPALIFSSLITNFSLKELMNNYLLPIGAIIIMLVGYFIGIFFTKLIEFNDEKEKNSFHFQCTINNYSFLPLPIIFMLWSDKGVAKLIFSSLGSEISVWTIGILALTGNKFSKKTLYHLISVPMIAIFLSIFVIIIKSLIPENNIFFEKEIISEIWNSFLFGIDIFGKGTIPIAMFIVGGRMVELNLKKIFSLKHLYLVIIRLIIIPGICGIIFSLLPFENSIRNILLVVGVMPCAIASVVLGEVYDADIEFNTTSVLTTHLFSLITIPIWLYIFIFNK